MKVYILYLKQSCLGDFFLLVSQDANFHFCHSFIYVHINIRSFTLLNIFIEQVFYFLKRIFSASHCVVL